VNPYAAAAIVLATALVQATAAPHMAVMGVRPNLPLVLVTSWGLLRGSGDGLWWGLGAGLATDLFAGMPLGMFAAGLALSGGVAGLGERQVFRTNILMPALMIVANTLLASLVTMGVMKVLDWPVYLVPALRTAVLPEAAYNLALMVIVFPLMTWLHRRTAGETISW
jgi:rod shape-determining protein MreD